MQQTKRKQNVCSGCNGASYTTRKCTGCDLALYCSKECQKKDWVNHRHVCGKSMNEECSSGSQCKYCRKSSPDLKRCSRCLTVSYCSKECQRKDWGSHKPSCKGASDQEVTNLKSTAHNSLDKKAPVTGSCRKCAKTECKLWCSRCKTTFYCSKECQREDWKNHKVTDCKDRQPRNKNKNATTNEDTDQREQHCRPFAPFGLPECLFRSPEMLRYVADRPPGSLEKANSIAKRRFSLSAVIDDLDHVPFENPYLLFREIQKAESRKIFVAFMFKYDSYARRHAIYIKDKKDKVTKVEFYLDFENHNPLPFFSYSQVRPGNYLCLLNPLMHAFKDGTIGIRVDDPSEVFIIDGRSVT